MPTYQYVCTVCDQPHEAVQSFSDAALTACPACDGRLRKVYGAVGVVFKGSGFYKTDSREGAKKASAPAAKSDGAAASTGGSSDSGSGSGSGSSTSGSGTSGTGSTPAAKPAASGSGSSSSSTPASKSA